MAQKDPHSTFSPAARVLSVAGLLALAVVAILVYDGVVSTASRAAASAHFQRMAGGLGMGATVCPRWCLVNFDPRIERCTCSEQPLPGGYCYCPEHGGTISFFLVDRPHLTVQRKATHRE